MARQKANPTRRCERDIDGHSVSLLSFVPSAAASVALPSNEADSTSPLPNINDGSTLENIPLVACEKDMLNGRLILEERRIKLWFLPGEVPTHVPTAVGTRARAGRTRRNSGIYQNRVQATGGS